MREQDTEQMGLSSASTHDPPGDEIYDIFLRSVLPLHYISTGEHYPQHLTAEVHEDFVGSNPGSVGATL